MYVKGKDSTSRDDNEADDHNEASDGKHVICESGYVIDEPRPQQLNLLTRNPQLGANAKDR
jgi:hypothetical protein